MILQWQQNNWIENMSCYVCAKLETNIALIAELAA